MKDDASRPNGEAPRSRPERTETDHLKDDVTAMVVPPPSIGAVSADTTPGASTLRPVVIDVMIAYTARAAMHYDDIRRDLVELTIEETNESFRASGLGHISVRLVGVHATDYSETGGQHFDHVWRMVDRGDGHLEEIPGLRNAMKADVVLLIVDDPSGCGLATRVAASEEEAYAVVHHACAASSYSVAHEIGHLLGARHDRSLDQNTTPFPYGHGYISPDLKWRTMMSYKAGCNGCARLPIWSSPNVDVKGNPAGNELTDNARVIREQAERVAAFR